MNATTKTVKDLIEMLNNGEIVREAYQRTPSHTTATANAIMQSILDSGKTIGTIVLAETETQNVFAIVDGSSRLKDFSDLVTVKKFGKTEYTDEQIQKVLNTDVNIMTYSGYETIARRASLFTALNSATALTGVQKHRTGESIADTLASTISNLTALCGGISDRQRQKDIAYKVAVDTVLTVSGNYTASASKQGEKLASGELSVDTDKLQNAINKIAVYLNSNTDNSVSAWALTFGLITLYKNVDFIVGDWLQMAVDTAGANSADKVEKGVKRFCRKAKEYTNLYNINTVTSNVADTIADTI